MRVLLLANAPFARGTCGGCNRFPFQLPCVVTSWSCRIARGACTASALFNSCRACALIDGQVVADERRKLGARRLP